LVKLAKIKGAKLERKEGKELRSWSEKRRGMSEHLYLAQHRGGRLGESDTMPGTAGVAKPQGAVHRYAVNLNS
jgi:hypothetical protein